jgi:hypothetical protein
MTPYPYKSSNICEKCNNPIIVRQKRDTNNKFCSKECYNQDRRKNKPIKLNFTSNYICLKCNNPFSPGRNTKGMYCSYACSNGAKSVRYKLSCECCNKEFEINNIAEIKRGHYKYCSNECRKRKYYINEQFFDVIDEKTSYWLGFIWATLWDNKYNKISLLSKKDLLERFNTEIESNYPIKKSLKNKYIIRVTSLKILSRLVEIGIKDVPYLEFPDIPVEYQRDFIRGYFDSDWGYHYKDQEQDVVVLHGRSSKLMKFISEKLDSKLVMDKGQWASISFNFNESINGQPRLEEKWNKFTKFEDVKINN